MNLKCPQCSTPIPPQNINVQQMVAACPQCGHVFKFDLSPVQGTTRLKRKVKAPVHLSIQQSEDDLRITFARDNNWGNKLGFIMTLLITAFGLLLVVSTKTDSRYYGIDTISGLILFFVGIVLTIWLLVSIVNRTSIVISPESLMIVHQPVEIPPPIFYNSAEIRQLYCKKLNHLYFELHALMTDGSDEILLTLIPEDDALYLEHVIEDYLGIQDMPVRGEY
jgi:hypothetical protein